MNYQQNIITIFMWLVVCWTPVKCQPESDLESVSPGHKMTETQILTTKEDYSIYEGCGINKTCFGYPYGCVENKTCFEMASAMALDNSYQFEMKTSSDNAKYIALGLSIDQRMGDDLVTECIEKNGNVKMQTSFTWNYGNTRNGVPQNTARLIQSFYKDGVIYCRFERDAATSLKDITFDLSKNKYFLLLAAGSKIKDDGIGYHDLSRTGTLKPYP